MVGDDLDISSASQIGVHTEGRKRNLVHFKFLFTYIKRQIGIPSSSLPRSCLTEKSITKTNVHGLELSIVIKRSLAQLTSNTTLLESTERKLVMKGVVCVDPDGTCAECIGDLNGGVQVGGMDGSGETVGAAVADADGVFLGGEFGNRADRAEDFFLHDLHVLRDVAEDGGLNEVASVSLALAANLNLRTSLLAIIYIAVTQVSYRSN